MTIKAEGYLETRLRIDNAVVAFKNDNSFQDTSRLYIAHISIRSQKPEAEVRIHGKNYTIINYDDLDDETNLRRFIDGCRKEKGWLTLKRVPGKKIYNFTIDKNNPDNLLVFEVMPYLLNQNVPSTTIGIWRKNNFRILRDEIVNKLIRDSRAAYGLLQPSIADSKQTNDELLEIVENYEFSDKLDKLIREEQARVRELGLEESRRIT